MYVFSYEDFIDFNKKSKPILSGLSNVFLNYLNY